MEAVAMERQIDRARIRAELRRIRDSKGKDGKGLAGVQNATGISRTLISQFVNNDYLPDPRKLEALSAYLEAEYWDEAENKEPVDSADAAGPVRRFGAEGAIFATEGYTTAFNAIDSLRNVFRTCVMIGHPGIGKTTLLREYAHQMENTYYIDCWPFMGMTDLTEAIARALGMSLRAGTVMGRIRQLLNALDERPGALLIYDEAENLAGTNARKLDTLRKLTDPEGRGTPHRTSLFAGTKALEDTMKRRMGQILRRAGNVPLSGVRAENVREMLRGYDVSEGARRGLTELAMDTARGGLGNFVEVLNICLNYTKGGRITDEIFRAARKYKLLY